MKKYLLVLLILLVVVAFSFSQPVQARGRYGSFRIGGYTNHGKGSHYIGGYLRSCRGFGCW
jgi:hypothetical protein